MALVQWLVLRHELPDQHVLDHRIIASYGLIAPLVTMSCRLLLRRVASRGVLPRERFSPLAPLRHANEHCECPLSGTLRKSRFSAVRAVDDPNETLDIASVLFRRSRIKTAVSNLGAMPRRLTAPLPRVRPITSPSCPQSACQVGDIKLGI